MSKILERYQLKNVNYKGKFYPTLGVFVYIDNNEKQHTCLDLSGHSADILDKVFREDLRIKDIHQRLLLKPNRKIHIFDDSSEVSFYVLKIKTPKGTKYIAYDDKMKCTGSYCDFDEHNHTRYYPPLRPTKYCPFISDIG